ncbi:polysaccharide deacetylase [Clostridium botulinum]|uniref:Polysaccharide deacetylase n=2 Tax=Clostridium botulinum TaxID=1491 RepID=A0A9Q1UZ33_CLOBO|nr:polysaccharide deacetylase family sporulation protein PdaB [Clostridium botulinum]AEB75601.1 Predicted xylanase/chitin deacetylase [Clostridium botulinum BKT015925]KEH99541.1 polysaccharide deacetylase [Clostridium botulinum D str. 16868]KEI04328.1 polysaccharide deacetylase [Clostridium botulinum C/D str. Sp77]KOA76572.1 polysaccharide deacetylase [Clostridium botulinum]KOA78496.1 polysaccharide deacetylase [Clostridium botulinum]
MNIQTYLEKIKKHQILIVLGVFVFLAAFFLGVNFKNLQAMSRESKKYPIYSVDTNEKKIAITFDTNWGTNNTKKVLDILDKYDAKATFFLMGTWIDKHENETKEIFNRGHEIGNHSNSHADFTLISRTRIIEEIAATDAKLMKLLGKGTEVFRFPSGSYNEKSLEIAESTNHYCIQWNVDSIDWKEQGADIEYNRVMKKIKPGSILLFHDNAKYTPETLPRILSDLKAKGYQFVKVSDLIYKKGYYMDNSGTQKLKLK